MSGVYIPHMALPKTCRDCCFCVWDAETWCGRANYEICDGVVDPDSKPEWCDLIPVPDHGRLVDADALMKQVEHDAPLSAVYEKTMRRYLNNAPTIIPGDKKEVSTDG